MAIVTLELKHNDVKFNDLRNSLTEWFDIQPDSEFSFIIVEPEKPENRAKISWNERKFIIEVDDSLHSKFLIELAKYFENFSHYYLEMPMAQIGMIGEIPYARNYFELAFSCGWLTSETKFRNVKLPALVIYDFENGEWTTASIAEIEAFLAKERQDWRNLNNENYLEFLNDWNRLDFQNRAPRLGKMFIERFEIQDVAPGNIIDKLVELDGSDAREFIRDNFNLV